MSRRRSTAKIIVLSALLTTAFAGLLSRLLFLHFEFDQPFQQQLERSQKVERVLKPRRGRIMDRQGNIFALDVRLFHVILDPKRIADTASPDAVAAFLAPLLNLDAQKVAADISMRAASSSGSRYYRVKKYVSDEVVDRIKAGMDALELPNNSIYFEEAFQRRYPKDTLMSHVVGFVNAEGLGCAGIEQSFDDQLSGEPGKVLCELDGLHREIYSRREVVKEPVNGADVYLTLDQEIQHITENALNDMFMENKPQAAWAIVQRVRTGEILAMASIPAYNLNEFNRAPADWRLNRNIGVVYEPGSTMKAVSIAGALNENLVVPEEIIDCGKGVWYYLGHSLEEYHHHHYGKLSVADVLKKSSNIGTAKIALRLGEAKLEEYIRAFGFGERLDCGLIGEEKGLFRSHKDWSKIDITRICIGHSIAVTALQMANAMSCLANEGRLMRPTVVRKVVASDGTVLRDFKPECIGRPVRPEVARTMCRLLARVTEEGGTATTAQVEGYKVAGKTGTATKPNPNGRGYMRGHNIASFAGFIPAERPEVAIIVVADDPQGKRTGGSVSGPVFQKIADQTMRYLGIPSSETTEVYTDHAF